MQPNSRFGFTLVELLVVITIIGILAGLLVPGVNMAREAGRRTTCMNNIKQVATGCLQHESKLGFLPTGGHEAGSGMNRRYWSGDPEMGYTPPRQPGGWLYNVLPFIELADLHDNRLPTVMVSTGTATVPKLWPDGNPVFVVPSDWDASTEWGASQVRAGTPVALFLCPSRHALGRFPHGPVPMYSSMCMSDPPSFGNSDYAANAGDWNPGTADASIPPSPPTAERLLAIPRPEMATGAIFCRSMVQMSSIKDGAGNTYLLGERSMDPLNYTNGQAPDNCGFWDLSASYDTLRWTTLPPALDMAGVVAGPDPVVLTAPPSTVFGSAHAAGFHMAFCDGHVQRMSFSIDPRVHRSLGNRNDGNSYYNGDSTKLPPPLPPHPLPRKVIDFSEIIK